MERDSARAREAAAAAAIEALGRSTTQLIKDAGCEERVRVGLLELECLEVEVEAIHARHPRPIINHHYGFSECEHECHQCFVSSED